MTTRQVIRKAHDLAIADQADQGLRAFEFLCGLPPLQYSQAAPIVKTVYATGAAHPMLAEAAPFRMAA